MNKRLVLLMPVFAFLLLLSCKPQEEQKIAPVPPRAVRTQTLVARDLPRTVEAVGRLSPNREVVVSSQVAGIIQKYQADVGARVTNGQVLVKIDPADYILALKEAEANLLAAEARLAAAEKNFERVRLLLPDQVITPETFDRSEAEFKSSLAATAQLEAIVGQARRRLDKTTIRTPFEGHVTRRFVELGQNVGVADSVMQVADMATMRVRIHINERDYVNLDPEDPVSLRVEAYPDVRFSGRVDEIGIQADPQTNTFEVEVLVDNGQFLLKAGLTARVSIRTEVVRDAVMIPQSCVLFREQGTEVFVVEEGELAAVRRVQLGAIQGSDVQVLEGLAAGDSLVVTGGQYLKDGDRVAVAP
jgi:RND family efflux transporter MFP subunit